MLSILMLAVFCLGACNFGNGGTPGTGGGEELPDNFIYGAGSELYIVSDEQIPAHYISPLSSELFYYEVDVRTVGADSEVMPHELVIGRTDRAISKTAYDRLERIDLNEDGDLRFLIYSDGSSVAIAYDEDKADFCIQQAIEHFKENYCVEQLVQVRGVMHEEVVNLYEHYGELDREKTLAKWQKLYDDYGAEVTDALKQFYAIYDGEKLMTWLINLFDPSICVCKGLYGEEECSGTALCGTGGFYFSNSARDTVGFLPDVESTLQALGLLQALGMGASSYVTLLPEWMGNAIAEFTINLQDPDGFFYHPQWGKNISTSRRSRDFNWSRNILDAYGRDSKYPMIDDVAPTSGALRSMLGTSVVTAASKVIAADSTLYIPEHLQTLEAFKDYLENTLDFYNAAYPAGNTLGSQSAQITARGQEYVDAMFEHMDKAQNPENGLWHKNSDYYGVNGLMKISGIYKSYKRTINYADKAALACFDAIMSEENPSGIVDVWNPWVAISYVLENIKLFAEDGEAKHAELLNLLVENSVGAILATRDKTAKFARDDGSYSYVQTGNCTHSQSAPVAVPGHSEGDVNGCMIATTQMIGFVISTLGMGSYNVGLCGQRERAIMNDMLDNIKPVKKIYDSVDMAGDPESFDYNDVGEAPYEVKNSAGEISPVSSAIVEADPRGEGNVLTVYKKSGSFDGVTFRTQGTSTGAKSTVYTADICLVDVPAASDFLRIEMGGSSDTTGVYRVSFRPNGDKIDIYENSSSDGNNSMFNYLGVSVSEGEWFNIRIEFYPGEGTAETVRAKVYFNGKLLSVSDNYYDYYGKKFNNGGKPNTGTGFLRFQFLTAVESVVMFDDIHAYYSKNDYTISDLHEDYASNPYATNVDKVYDNATVYGFDDQTAEDIYAGIITQGTTGTVGLVDFEGGKALSLTGGGSVKIPSTRTASGTNVAIVSTDLYFDASSSGTVGSIELRQHVRNDGFINRFNFVVGESGGNRVIKITESAKGTTVGGYSLPIGQKINFKIEYYYKDNVILFYTDGVLLGICSEFTTTSKRYIFDEIAINGSAGLIVDNVSAAHSNKDYTTTMEPKEDSYTHTFDSGLGTVTTTGTGVSLKGVAGGKVLEISGTASTTVTVPAKERDIVMNVNVIELDLEFINKTKIGNHILSVVDNSGKKIFSFALSQKSGKAHIYENTALGVHQNAIAEIDASKAFKLGLHYYENEGICKIYVDGKYVMASSFLYNEDSALLTPAAFKIESTASAAAIRVDNVVFDRLRKAFLKETAPNMEDEASEITFGYSGGNSYPSTLTAAIVSSAPLPTVTEMVKDGALDKVLKYVTQPGGGDKLNLYATEKTGRATAYEVEFEAMFVDTVAFQFYLCNPSEAIVSIIYFEVSAGDIYMYTRNSESKASEKVYVGKLGEWLNFRFEYYCIDGSPKIKSFVNDRFLMESGAEYPRIGAMSTLGVFTFYGLSGGNGVMYLDNLSFKQTTKTYAPEK